MSFEVRTPGRRARRGTVAGLTALAALALVAPSTPVQAAGPRAASASAASTTGTAASGYWMLGSDGKVYAFGASADLGSPALPAGAHATHIESTPDGGGYYVLDDRGDVFAFGHAASLGNAALAPGESAVSLSVTPSGQGYWVFTSAGRVITKGDAHNLGDMAGTHLNAPVVSSTVTPDGSGYWMVAGDGGVFSFGAPFWGSTGNLKLNKPVEGIVPTLTNKGYWLVASDGGIFAFGDAAFKGSMGSTKLNKPVVGMVRYGDGYLMVASDGGIFDFSSFPFQGSLGANPPAHPIVGTAPLPTATAPAPVGVPAPAPTGGGTAPNPAPVNLPPGTLPAYFSSTALTTYGSALDPNNTYSNNLPYAQTVDSVVEIGDKVYVAGEFTNMVDTSNAEAPASPALPFLVVLDKNTWKPDPTSPFNTAANQPNKPVLSLTASPDGKTLYAGGQFTQIGGGSSVRVAALDTTTGQLKPGWSSPQPNAAVNSVVLSNDGQHLYIGGSFSHLGLSATPTTYLAELDAATGAQIPDFASPTDYGGMFQGHGGLRIESPPAPAHASVHDLALSRDGSTLIVGGDFLHFGVQSDPSKNHAGLLTVDATTGQMTPWQPINTRPVFQITDSVVDSKAFYVAAGGAGGNIQQFHIGAGTGTPDWKVEVDGDGTGVAATADAVYLVGHFGHVAASAQDVCTVQTNPNQSCDFTKNGNTNRFNHLAAFDLTGKLLPTFTAQANTPKGPEFAYLGAQDLYVGGDFTGVASAPNPDPTALNVYRKQPGLAVFPACPSAAAC